MKPNVNRLFALFAMFAIVFVSCEDLDVENLNNPDAARAVSNDADVSQILAAGVFSAMRTHSDVYQSHVQEMGDMHTATNKYIEFWDFAQEPRLRINNTQAYGGRGVMTAPWGDGNSANSAANIVLDYLDRTGGLELNGVDRSTDVEAASYFAKGLAQGYLGVYFNKAYLVDNDTEVQGIDFTPYTDMIDAGIAALEQAITIAQAAPASFMFDWQPGLEMDKDLFIQVANSYAARILASKPRSEAEAVALGAAHWNKVKAFAQAGVTEDYIVTVVSGDFAPQLIDWAAYRLSDGAGYIPVDLKGAWMASSGPADYDSDAATPDVDYPDYYPSYLVAPVVTDDARFDEYFAYTQNFGYLNGSRNRGLFSNYAHDRWWNANNSYDPGAPWPIFMTGEIDMILAEAEVMLGNNAAAIAIINGGNRVNVGGLAPLAGTETADEIMQAIHYEYTIDLPLAAGGANPWTFMRRNDMLIVGTATQLPIPAGELASTGLDPYTFGGSNNAGEVGEFGEIATATGAKAWKAGE